MRGKLCWGALLSLFAVESLRMLAGRGVMVAEGDTRRYRVIDEVTDLDVPPSIHALIAARVDQLGGAERAVLRAGAVIGQRFTFPAAATLSGVGKANARPLLESLVAKQFLEVDEDPRSPHTGATCSCTGRSSASCSARSPSES